MQSLFSIISLVMLCLLQSSSHAQNSAQRILILGDSLSAAYNIPVEQSWPRLFSQQLKTHYPAAQVTNASISGETTFGGRQRLPQLLKRIHPNYLIIELGGNDGLRGLTLRQMSDNLKTMITLAMQQQMQVLLVAVDLPPNLGVEYNRRFQATFRALSEQYDIHYLPHFLAGVAAADPQYMQADGIHPTAVAQPLLADKILTAILPMLKPQ